MSNDSSGDKNQHHGSDGSLPNAKSEKKSFLDHFSGLSEALSNDENGFSNKEGFNTDRGHEPLADTQSVKDDTRNGKDGSDHSTSNDNDRRFGSQA